MFYVCKDCGLIATGYGRILSGSIYESTRCVGGNHLWVAEWERKTDRVDKAIAAWRTAKLAAGFDKVTQ